jgi:hypothetical protein
LTGSTVTNVEAEKDVVCVEVAVIVIICGEVTTGAVKTPRLLMVPALAVQVTVISYAPVPVTLALHCKTWPD